MARIRRRARWFVAGVLIGLAVVGALTTLWPKQYTAVASDYFTVASGGSDANLYQGSLFVSSQIDSYRSLAVSLVVLRPVIEELKLSMDADTLATDHVVVTAPDKTTILRIQVTLPDARKAADTANAVAAGLAKQAEILSPDRSTGRHVVDARVLEAATTPPKPSSPNVKNNLIFGTAAAIALGLGLALLRDSFDTSVRTSRELAKLTDYPILATLPREKRPVRWDRRNPKQRSRLRAGFLTDRGSRAVRLLRDNFLGAGSDRQQVTTIVTSLSPYNGKSTVALALATTLGQSGHRTLLIDASTNGDISSALALSDAPGLTEALAGTPVEPVSDETLGCSVLPRGHRGDLPVGSGKVEQLLSTLHHDYDYIVLDAVSLDQPGRLQDLAANATDILWVVDAATPAEGLSAIRDPRISTGSTTSLVLNRAEPADEGQGSLRSRSIAASALHSARHARE